MLNKKIEIKSLVWAMLLMPLFVYGRTAIVYGGTIDTKKIDELLAFKKNEYLKKYEPQSIKKPVKQNYPKERNISKPTKETYPKAKNLKKDPFETTPEYNVRVEKENKRVERLSLNIDKEYGQQLIQYYQEVKKEKNRIQKEKNKIDNTYTKQLAQYNIAIKKQKQKQQDAKDKLPTILSQTLPDILNIYLDTPKIEAFEKNDVSKYNADDNIFYTKIVSKYLNLNIALQMDRESAKKLYTSNKLKKIKPIIYFEYANDKLYVNNIKAVYKKQEFVVMPQLKEYKPEFKLKEKVADIKFTWSKDYKVKDKKFLVSYKAKLEKTKLAKQKAKRLAKLTIWKDPDTKLIWLKKIPKDEYNWDDAKQYCEDLTLGGYSEWKLPSRDELKTILTKEPFKNKNSSIKKTYIKKPLLKSMDMKWQYFWSSSEYKEDSSKAWLVIFDNGNDDWSRKTFKNFVRCVRQRQ